MVTFETIHEDKPVLENEESLLISFQNFKREPRVICETHRHALEEHLLVLAETFLLTRPLNLLNKNIDDVLQIRVNFALHIFKNSNK